MHASRPDAIRAPSRGAGVKVAHGAPAKRVALTPASTAARCRTGCFPLAPPVLAVIMLCNTRHMGFGMARGKSGRIVVEIDEALKRQLYAVLATRALTLKEWFTQQAGELVADHNQPSLLPDRADQR